MLVEEELIAASFSLDGGTEIPIMNPDYEDGLLVESLEETSST